MKTDTANNMNLTNEHLVCTCGAESWGPLKTASKFFYTKTYVLNTNCFNCKTNPYCHSCRKENGFKVMNEGINKTPLRCVKCRCEYM